MIIDASNLLVASTDVSSIVATIILDFEHPFARQNVQIRTILHQIPSVVGYYSVVFFCYSLLPFSFVRVSLSQRLFVDWI